MVQVCGPRMRLDRVGVGAKHWHNKVIEAEDVVLSQDQLRYQEVKHVTLTARGCILLFDSRQLVTWWR
jgi:hypothetical protein